MTPGCGALFLIAALAAAQTFDVTPAVVPQGDTLHVRGSGTARSARLNGRTIPLFPEPGGGTLGLMPVPVETKPGSQTIEFLDAQGAVLHKVAVAVRDARFASQNIVLGRAVTELKPAPGEGEQSAAFRKIVTGTRYWAEPLQLPVRGCMTSPFGVQRLQNGKPTGNIHAGIDQRGAQGTPIHAIAGGVVKLVRAWTLHGNTVGIDHGQGLESLYQHMSKFAVSEGAVVNQGDVIGYVGSTGRSTAPHLHWSLYVNGVPVNPAQWVPLHACTPAKAPARQRAKRL